MPDKNDFFVDANRHGEPCEHFSPSGLFRLTTQAYRTGDGTWNYTRGIVQRVDNDEPICVIDRNYSVYHHSFVTKDGREWLIAGENYMGQTIVDLEAGAVYHDPKHPNAYQGNEFCWAVAMLSPDGNTLVVDGCHWACPYEHRFYDFTNPSQGWPELTIKGDECLYAMDDENTISWNADGAFTWTEGKRIFTALGIDDDAALESDMVTDEAYDDDSNWHLDPHVRVVLRRDGSTMALVEHWLSESEKERRTRTKAVNEKRAAQIAAWRAESELYQALPAMLEARGLENRWDSMMFPSVNDKNNGEPNPSFHCPCLQISDKSKRNEKRSVNLKWGVIEGRIFVERWTYGFGVEGEPTSYPRTLEGLDLAMDFLEMHLRGPLCGHPVCRDLAECQHPDVGGA